MNQLEINMRLSIYRYAILAVTITAFTVSLFTPVIFTSNPNFVTAGFSLKYSDVFVPSLFVASAAALIGVMSYVMYAHSLYGMTKQKNTVVVG